LLHVDVLQCCWHRGSPPSQADYGRFEGDLSAVRNSLPLVSSSFSRFDFLYYLNCSLGYNTPCYSKTCGSRFSSQETTTVGDDASDCLVNDICGVYEVASMVLIPSLVQLAKTVLGNMVSSVCDIHVMQVLSDTALLTEVSDACVHDLYVTC